MTVPVYTSETIVHPLFFICSISSSWVYQNG